MDISGKGIWQQGSGDNDRDYADICLRWDVILNGPGRFGPWPSCEEILFEQGRKRKIMDLCRFGKEMKDGDIVVLRRGTKVVCGVGQVVGDYIWHDEFGDVDGWSLEHVRRVRWLWTPKERDPKAADIEQKDGEFDTYTLKQGDTTQKLNLGPVTEWLSGLNVVPDSTSRQIVALPESGETNKTTLDEVSEFLFAQGVASGSIARLVNEMGELVRIANWYKTSGQPSEHETVAYLVVPLLRALGWTPQRMGVEWNRVDLALFDRLPRRNDSLTVVVEAKKMDSSCLTAISQARDYAVGKSNCHRLIVTDGLRYGVHVRKGKDFALVAYMNLTRLRNRYPIYGCSGASEALLAMAPEWKHEENAGQAGP